MNGDGLEDLAMTTFDGPAPTLRVTFAEPALPATRTAGG